MSTPAPGFRPPRIIAHRGASTDYPENTLAAFDAALAQGSDGVELDLQLSRDGIPLVYHDRSLRKIGGGGRAVRQTDWAEIAGLDAGGWLDPRHAGQVVPTLDQVLDRYARRTRLLLELKVRPRDKQAGAGVALAKEVAQRLRSRRLTRHVMVLCFDLETLELMTDLATGIPTVLNLKAPRRPTRSFRDTVDRVSAVSIDVRTLSAEVVAAVHDAGKPVLTYTCDGSRTVTRALDAGVDGVMTNRPGWLRQTLQANPGLLPTGWEPGWKPGRKP